MIQAWTVLLDSIRMLRASKIFAIALAISLLLALVFVSIRIGQSSFSIFFGLLEFEFDLSLLGDEGGKMVYIYIFQNTFIDWWLAWFAILLALISTCQIFPRFMESGSIEIPLSKPISRQRLFFLKYLTGHLFVFLQTGVFCGIVFIGLRYRLGFWNFSIFWAIPVISFAFGILYSVCVFMGVKTRSTLFSLLLTLVFWAFTLIPQWIEEILYQTTKIYPALGTSIDWKTGQLKDSADPVPSWLQRWTEIQHEVNVYIPKTRECTKSLIRLIQLEDPSRSDVTSSQARFPSSAQITKQLSERYTWAEIYLSAAVFQILLCAWSMRIFCRRDY